MRINKTESNTPGHSWVKPLSLMLAGAVATWVLFYSMHASHAENARGAHGDQKWRIVGIAGKQDAGEFVLTVGNRQGNGPRLYINKETCELGLTNDPEVAQIINATRAAVEQHGGLLYDIHCAPMPFAKDRGETF